MQGDIDFSIVSDCVRAFLYGASDDVLGQLEGMIRNLAANWEASRSALYITSSDGELETLVSHALEGDPLKNPIEPNAPSEGVAIQNAGRRVGRSAGSG